MAHSHDHAAPGHAHSHAPTNYGLAFAWGISLNVGFVVLELIAGFAVNSLALIADAGHNASDVLGLLLAWGGYALSKRRPLSRYTYGLQRSTIQSSLFRPDSAGGGGGHHLGSGAAAGES